jgi:hypothetical protein
LPQQAIAKSPFAWCGLEGAIEIPARTKYIMGKAFLNCTLLTIVDFSPDSRLDRIGRLTFAETGLIKVEIPVKTK